MKILGNRIISECTAYDFKDELERKKIRHWLKSVSAFANTDGGALYFGVNKDGSVTGLKDIQADSDFISEKINAHLDPLPEWTLTPASKPGAQRDKPQLGRPTVPREDFQAQLQDACERIPRKNPPSMG